jgi:hypothetical protein
VWKLRHHTPTVTISSLIPITTKHPPTTTPNPWPIPASLHAPPLPSTTTTQPFTSLSSYERSEKKREVIGEGERERIKKEEKNIRRCSRLVKEKKGKKEKKEEKNEDKVGVREEKEK